jgi:hypothetical protein
MNEEEFKKAASSIRLFSGPRVQRETLSAPPRHEQFAVVQFRSH